ncbi:MAG: hypothetical protein ACE5KV_01580 [Thermoplasmata archaeon]
MRVTVRIFPSGERKELVLGQGATGMSLIEVLGLTPDSHILVRSCRPIPIDEKLCDGETLTLISVVSGG